MEIFLLHGAAKLNVCPPPAMLVMTAFGLSFHELGYHVSGPVITRGDAGQ
jgi:hypothetical protein